MLFRKEVTIFLQIILHLAFLLPVVANALMHSQLARSDYPVKSFFKMHFRALFEQFISGFVLVWLILVVMWKVN